VTGARQLARCAVVAVAVGCNTPVPSLHIVPAGPPTQACPSTECANVMLRCPSIMSIRIFDPKQPTKALLSQCSTVPTDTHNDLCAVAQVDLIDTPLPVRELDVQIALFPQSRAIVDPNNVANMLCPDVQFGAASGFPIEQSPSPALGGRTLYHPGDSVVTVALGCTDLDAINASCIDQAAVDVTATVRDFPNEVSVASGQVELRVAVAEPQSSGGSYMIGGSDSHMLTPQPDTGLATWNSTVSARFTRYVCADVLESNLSEATGTVRCVPAVGARTLELVGSWLRRPQLVDYLSSLGASMVPINGLTLGVVLDPALNPVAGATVRTSVVGGMAGTVRYLTKAGFSATASSTSDTGIFVSTDAAFGTEFTAHAAGLTDAIGVGGLVSGRVTIVVLQLEPAV
jgi:hypothetical protein